MGKTNKWSAVIASAVDMSPSLALHSLGIWIVGMIDYTTKAKLEDAAGDKQQRTRAGHKRGSVKIYAARTTLNSMGMGLSAGMGSVSKGIT